MANIVVAYALERFRELIQPHRPSQCFAAAGRQRVVDILAGVEWPVDAQRRADAQCQCQCWNCRRDKHEPGAVEMGLRP